MIESVSTSLEGQKLASFTRVSTAVQQVGAGLRPLVVGPTVGCQEEGRRAALHPNGLQQGLPSGPKAGSPKVELRCPATRLCPTHVARPSAAGWQAVEEAPTPHAHTPTTTHPSSRLLTTTPMAALLPSHVFGLQAVEEALTRILTPKRSIDVLREVKAAQASGARECRGVATCTGCNPFCVLVATCTGCSRCCDGCRHGAVC